MQNAGNLPKQVVAGETIWISADNTAQGMSDITFAGYTPADGYTLAYQFAGTTPAAVAAQANAADTGWGLTVTAAETLTWKAGVVRFVAYVTHTESGKVYAVEGGEIAVIASPLATSSYTAALTACDAAIANYAANPHGSVGIGEMSVTYRSMADLIKLRDYLKSLIAEELGNRPIRIIRTRFT